MFNQSIIWSCFDLMARKHSRKSCTETVGVQKYICIVDFASGLSRILSELLCFDKKVSVLMF